MSSKDKNIFSKESLITTEAGRDILKQGAFHSKGYKQFQYYKEKSEKEFPYFVKRFVSDLYLQIKDDQNPSSTLSTFVSEVGSNELLLESSKINTVKSRLSDLNTLTDTVQRILNSNYVKMTYPVFHALFDEANSYLNLQISEETRNTLIDGHIIAIDLSEPMDRIIDRDEDLDYLDDYKLINPYMLNLARSKISKCGEEVLKSFEEGFKNAGIGQYVDYKLKINPLSISDENMSKCYKKYSAVMGTAGKNMALCRQPLAEIFYLGMARAGESVGCGNEIEDSLKNGTIKVPSWPLYYAINTNDVKKAFDLTIKKSNLYLEDARIALEMLPGDFKAKPFLDFLLMTVKHYNQFWYNQLKKIDRFASFEQKLSTIIKN
ncbi:MAG: hypothetical protein EX285_00455 [Thaumarchaeota archaeon]|nr:hypothetical protein [Nitrososphaerota archaeon]